MYPLLRRHCLRVIDKRYLLLPRTALLGGTNVIVMNLMKIKKQCAYMVGPPLLNESQVAIFMHQFYRIDSAKMTGF
jgi:hypothetical protein